MSTDIEALRKLLADATKGLLPKHVRPREYRIACEELFRIAPALLDEVERLREEAGAIRTGGLFRTDTGHCVLHDTKDCPRCLRLAMRSEFRRGFDAAKERAARLACGDCFKGEPVEMDPEGAPGHRFRGHLWNSCDAAAIRAMEPADE